MKHTTTTPNPRNPGPRGGRAFTLVELLLMIIIVAILISLLVVGMHYAVSGAKRTAGVQDVGSLRVAVQSFKNDFGFLPPLVQDGYPSTPDTTGPLRTLGSRMTPNVYAFSDPSELDFLRNIPPQNEDYRFSVYSLSYYLMGALDKSVDGIEGPGGKAPKRDGSFDFLGNATFDAYYEPKAGGVNFAPWQSNDDPRDGRFELQDRNYKPFRYYRWVQGDPANPNLKGVLNVPAVGGASKARSELGQAEFAIVAAGADKVFGDINNEGNIGSATATIEQIEDALGKRFTGSDPDAEAEAAARADNIVEVGR